MARRKLDSSQFAPEIIPYLLVTLCERVTALGVAPDRLLAGLGLRMEDLRAGALVSNRQAWRVIRRALQLSGCADLGLTVGGGQALDSFGLLGQALVAAPTLGDAVRLGVRHYPAGGALVDLELLESAEGIVVVLRPRLRDAAVVLFLVEELLVSVLELFQSELGERLPLQALELAYPAPPHAGRYATLFGCEPRFGCADHRFVIAADWLARPMPRHAPARFAQLRGELAHHAQQEAMGTVAAVERLLRRPGQQALSAAQLARALELSPRTLRRRLDEAGVSFRQLRDGVRAQAARVLLEDEGLTVAAASRRLGYSDPRAFRRACKRWLGQAPGGLRQAQ